MLLHASTKTQRGFTLMELLVVLGIFSMVVTASSDIFMLTNRSERKVFGLERTQSDARYTMEAMVREIRTGTIDYAYYAARTAPLAAPETELALIDSTHLPIRFFLSDQSNATLCAADSAPCLLVSVNGSDPSPITPKGESVQGLAFYIAPLVDPVPFHADTGTYAANEQPRVTIVLDLVSTTGQANERTTLRLQTTATNRTYRR